MFHEYRLVCQLEVWIRWLDVYRALTFFSRVAPEGGPRGDSSANGVVFGFMALSSRNHQHQRHPQNPTAELPLLSIASCFLL